jgi:hypothetical protein
MFKFKVLSAAALALLTMTMIASPVSANRHHYSLFADDDPSVSAEADNDRYNGGYNNVEYDRERFSIKEETYVTCSSLSDAGLSTGFALILPDTVNGISNSTVTIQQGNIIQAHFVGSDSEIFIRKSAGSVLDDNADHPKKYTGKVKNTAVTFIGREGGDFIALWVKDDFAYEVRSTKALSHSAMASIVSGIIEKNTSF